jgi:lipoate-protein ligase A
MGNTNFSIMLPRLLFTRNHGAELVAKAVRERLGVEQCTVNERNDVIIRDGERDLKVSPSMLRSFTRAHLDDRFPGRRTRSFSTGLIIMAQCSSRLPSPSLVKPFTQTQ